jgi:hypothetical protein
MAAAAAPADSFTKRRRSISIDAAVHANAPPAAASSRVPLMVVEEIEGATPASPPDAVFVTLPDAALRLNVATRDQVRICWQRAPACVLIVKKLRDAETTEHLIQARVIRGNINCSHPKTASMRIMTHCQIERQIFSGRCSAMLLLCLKQM